MEMFKKRTFWEGLLGGVVASILVSALTAFAASSFSYGTFLQLIGQNNLAPFITSLNYTNQLQSPTITVASSTSGTLSGGPLVIEVAALTLTGTSTPSNEFATTTIPNQAMLITWPPIPGASGYAVYVGTSTSGSEASYLMGTSTAGVPNTQYTLQSTSSVILTTIQNQGAGYYTTEGSATTSIDTTGLLRAQSNATTTCVASITGSMFYNPNNSHLWLCVGGAWVVVK
jgi:hypothetical protein